jgi:hypothetical protein
MWWMEERSYSGKSRENMTGHDTIDVISVDLTLEVGSNRIRLCFLSLAGDCTTSREK